MKTEKVAKPMLEKSRQIFFPNIPKATNKIRRILRNYNIYEAIKIVNQFGDALSGLKKKCIANLSHLGSKMWLRKTILNRKRRAEHLRYVEEGKLGTDLVTHVINAHHHTEKTVVSFSSELVKILWVSWMI